MSPKRFTIPELESENAKKRRIANEATAATDCYFCVEFKPRGHLSCETILPVNMRSSRGHLFFIKAHDIKIDTWLDDREGTILELLAEHLRGLAEKFVDLAAGVESARLKGGGV